VDTFEVQPPFTDPGDLILLPVDKLILPSRIVDKLEMGP
jgi:hypothetical protein